MKEQFCKKLTNNPGLKQIKEKVFYYTERNMKILYQGSNILSEKFMINPYIAISCNSDINFHENSCILYPIIDFYDNLIVGSELIRPYDSVLLSIKKCESKINGYDILDATCGENITLLQKENLNFLLRRYFSYLFIIND